jgi:hypothetical protein
MGTYINSAIGKDKLMRKSMAAVFGLRDRNENPEKVTMTLEVTRNKRFLPGVGSYKPNYEV